VRACPDVSIHRPSLRTRRLAIPLPSPSASVTGRSLAAVPRPCAACLCVHARVSQPASTNCTLYSLLHPASASVRAQLRSKVQTQTCCSKKQPSGIHLNFQALELPQPEPEPEPECMRRTISTLYKRATNFFFLIILIFFRNTRVRIASPLSYDCRSQKFLYVHHILMYVLMFRERFLFMRMYYYLQYHIIHKYVLMLIISYCL
jgi:hypothetical protein